MDPQTDEEKGPRRRRVFNLSVEALDAAERTGGTRTDAVKEVLREIRMRGVPEWVTTRAKRGISVQVSDSLWDGAKAIVIAESRVRAAADEAAVREADAAGLTRPPTREALGLLDVIDQMLAQVDRWKPPTGENQGPPE